MDVLRCGRHAALIELDSREEVGAVYAQLRADRPPGVLDLVPAAATVLVRFDPRRTSFAEVRERVSQLRPDRHEARPERSVVVPVRYDGPDLAQVARVTGLTRDEVIERHAGADYTVAFCGFAPGFAYLTGLDPALRLARRRSPRTRVPAGAVAIADAYTGIYPRPSPGGWHLLGTCPLALFDPRRDPPALLTPGVQVRIQVIR